MPERHAKLFEVDLGQLRKDIRVDVTRAKERLVLSEAETSKPTPDFIALPGHERIFLWLKRPVQGRAVEELGRARSGGPAIAGLGTVPSTVYPSSLALGEMANPRKTRIARFSRRMSSSSKRPICAPTLDFGTVVILSTISRVVANSPLRSFGLTGRRNKGASV